jgi:DNA-binding CsgD family transcriptional regulator
MKSECEVGAPPQDRTSKDNHHDGRHDGRHDERRDGDLEKGDGPGCGPARQSGVADAGLTAGCGGPHQITARPVPPELAIAQLIVAHVYGVPLDSLLASTRKGRREAEARQVAMYLAHVVFRMSLADIARSFGRDRSTARHACLHVEHLREDPSRDRLVAWLEALLRQDGAEVSFGPPITPQRVGPPTIDLDAEVLS